MPPRRSNNQRSNNASRPTNTPSQATNQETQQTNTASQATNQAAQPTNTNLSLDPTNRAEPTSDPSTHKKRLPNFSPEEDEQLAKSWTVVTTDPIRSNDQTKEVFWSRVAEDYNKFTGGPQRDDDRLSARWKLLQNGCLKFTAIHNRIEQNPPSGSSPEDWLTSAKQIYYEQVGKHFMSDRAWNLLRHVEKFKTLAGRAKNGAPPSTQSQTPQVPVTPSPPDATDAASNAGSRSKDWERPTGAHAAKRHANEEEYKRKKIKLMEATHKESVKRSAEAKRSNDIQAELVAGEQKKINVNLMFQNPANCPDDISRRFLLAQKEKIFQKWMDPSFNSPSLSSERPADQSSHAPTDRSTQFGTSEPDNAMSPYDRQEDEDIPDDEVDDYDECDPLQTQSLEALDAAVDPTLF
ncbi:hypothetical protein PGT21_024908 [Puccinia graminis f. sp. tritici]|uniref:No apical meristem-associated C-terminal domain-containing protein n=2 Tax=Puccinia graminis f. sp. tritici TaxID=56615 RepID=H6QTM4_PUCGT|nr:uncharacterized protein PGTG_22061 [Puccinia graminis f. sp. tritici CRL 75-36-700-3]EHS64235.1 hypothetical protein PGTG_22061 [Puccinia graminis f. sp. tritici CRL 75-36-700-3]KAA1113204.1 hypothetical protein PGT21_024908 [Puccinia graminis f. sp. tritici]